MALVTVQRSPSVSSSPQSSDSGAGAPTDEEDATRGCKSLSECYFAGKGAALILPPTERARPSRRVSAAGCDIQQHLQSMFWLLRPEETLKMAVKLESVHPGRTRYLVVVSCNGNQDAEESCLLGIDCHAQATVGLVLRVLADTAITLDGDGGFSVSVCGRQHIFKPVSVQAMWSALQTLHKVSSKAREQNYFAGGLSHDWVSYYEKRIASDRSCLNEWNAMDNLESRRPPSPDSVRTKPREREETERVIRATLKEIMMSVDLDEVTSKYIRGRLEEQLDMDLVEFKPFIDQEMLIILGQMDAPTEIFDHVYLGSEWNASNLEELQKNGVRHILNVTREIDNFFPGMFNYLNVRVYDDEKTDLLKHWDDTFKYITKARKEGSKVLVHCKMGVSRSASVVIAYAMKAYNWDFSQALKHVKNRRNCIKPNSSFLSQLETYQGILDAMKNKERLQRSKSDTNLKSPTRLHRSKTNPDDDKTVHPSLTSSSGTYLKKRGQRPKSWEPQVELQDILPAVPLSQSLENIEKASGVSREDLLRPQSSQKQGNVLCLIPCTNGQSYSVSQNQIVHLEGSETPTTASKTPKKFTYPLKKSPQGQKRRGLVLNLTNQFEAAGSKPGTPEDAQLSPELEQKHIQRNDKENALKNSLNEEKTAKALQGNEGCYLRGVDDTRKLDVSQKWSHTPRKSSKADKSPTPSKQKQEHKERIENNSEKPQKRKLKKEDPFSAHVDKVFDREERREPPRDSPSRQSSWSSYDSAVGLDTSVHTSWGTLPSRNSSWGSYDMRGEPRDPLGSSGLFPYDREEIPWHPGTVKRTKQKLEEGNVKRVCTQVEDDKRDESTTDGLQEDILGFRTSPTPRRRGEMKGESRGIEIRERNHQVDRLSTSAPVPSSLLDHNGLGNALRTCRSESETSNQVVDTTQCPSVKHHKMILENLSKTKRFFPGEESPEVISSSSSSSSSEGHRGIPGIVKNLKKEFEAKSTRFERSPEGNDEEKWPRKEKTKVRSLPSSPVIAHNDGKIRGKEEERDGKVLKSNEDLSVRVLVDKYEKPGVKMRGNVHPPAKSRIATQEFARRSAPVMMATGFMEEGDRGRPPVGCQGVIATVVAKAASKKQQQHGRTHPLTRLQVRPRLGPLYNTM
ncbi:protein phosphatase Slingshot isoform X3 [Fopius arisanus]|uniref:protein-serine/threonine phosphatase n=1 Tax=Fopius arisanus TaxID=64838 RepID=A0A9R1SU83_9HYME|nr:PREDICTED: protein phosphatase Slingshot isoform X3 [Fopius arisanus]